MRELWIPDLHLGFTNLDYLHEVYKFNLSFKADVVWQYGDLLDFYNFSRFLKSPNAPSLTEELKMVKRQAEYIGGWFPKMRALLGNHEKRIYKRAAEAGIPKFWLKDILEVVGAPKGWKYEDKDYNDSDGVMRVHGHLGGNAKKAHADFYGMPTAHGHIHNQLGIEWNAKTRDKRWGASLSCIVDKNSIAMAYNEQDYKNIICGFGFMDQGKPYVECLG